MQKLREKLSKYGLKVTTPRLAVYEVLLKTKEHPTAEEVIIQVNQKYPAISSSTIYKTLDTYVARGIIKRLKTECNKMRYDLFIEHHHHIYHKDTDKITDYYDSNLDKILGNYFKEHGISDIEIEDIHVQINAKQKQ